MTDAEIAGQWFDPRWLHIEDAVQAVRCALRQLEETPSRGEWDIYHISCGDRAKIRPRRARGERFGYQPAHDFAEAAAADAPARPDQESATALVNVGAEFHRTAARSDRPELARRAEAPAAAGERGRGGFRA